MKILAVGAGAIGGYFGGRLQEKGEDVTFLVREGRKKQLEATGLVIESIHGNVSLVPKTITAGETSGPFDVILLSTKAYHLEKAIEDIRPYAGRETIILPLLNGIEHMDILEGAFGEDNLIGGLCFIETTLDSQGRVIQTSPVHNLVFGERSGKRTERILKLEKAFSGTKANFYLSDHIDQDLWQKYLFITTMSGITTLMGAPIGPIREQPYGRSTVLQLTREIIAIMKRVNAPLAEKIESIQMKQIDGLGYDMKSSMQRDMEKHLPVEADHLQGYLLKIASKEEFFVPVLAAVYANLKVYENQLKH